ncbi:ATP-binding cassette domain-containing protein [Actinosynnema sp. NPDC091369]
MSGTSTTDFTLRAVDLHKAFGTRQVLRGVDFSLRRGEIMGIIGENGAGKTTLLRVLSGELKADRGAVVHRDRLGYCPQRIVVNDELTVEQHLRYFQCAYRLTSLDRAQELVERLALARYRRTKAGVLSGGTRQKLNLVIALMHDPGVVLMDEPYQGSTGTTTSRSGRSPRSCATGASRCWSSRTSRPTWSGSTGCTGCAAGRSSKRRG